MDNSSAIPPDVVQMIIQQTQDANAATYALLASLTLIVYSTVLALSDEIELMWMKRPSIPAVLYFFARYSPIVFFCSAIVETFLPLTAPISTCNSFANLGNAMGTLAYAGIQGLLVARAYSLSQSSRGKWLVIGLSASNYLAGVVLSIYESAAFPGCVVTTNESIILQRFNLAQGCLSIVTDTIVFAVTIYQLWGTWTLQRDLKQETSTSITALLFRQGIFRYCFVLLVTLTNTVLSSGVISTELSIAFTFLQEALSAILLCGFSLHLRRRNKPQIDSEDVNVKTLSWSFHGVQTAFRQVHGTITAELGEFDTTSSYSLELDPLGAAGSPETETEMAPAPNQMDIEAAIDIDGTMPTTAQLSPGEFPWAVPGISPSDPSPSRSGGLGN